MRFPELHEPDWATRREIVRALVKQVEIDDQEVRVVYRVSPSLEKGPNRVLRNVVGGGTTPATRSNTQYGWIWVDDGGDPTTPVGA